MLLIMTLRLYTAPWTAQTDARKAVRFERRLELAMEGHRSFDLRRWGVAETVMNRYIAEEGETITPFAKGQSFQSKHTLFPIPLSAIDGSGGVITSESRILIIEFHSYYLLLVLARALLF